MPLLKLASSLSDYIREATYTRKLQDTSVAALLIILYGVASGSIILAANVLPLMVAGVVLMFCVTVILSFFTRTKKTTVERSFIHSEKVKRVLDACQIQHGFPVVVHSVFHNGVSDLAGRFSFIKMTAVEHSTADHITFNPLNFRDLPYMVDIHMITALVDDQIYTKTINYSDDPMGAQYKRLGVKSICVAPISSKGSLNSFLWVGSEEEGFQFDEEVIRGYAKKIESNI